MLLVSLFQCVFSDEFDQQCHLALGEIRTKEYVQKFRQDNLGEIGQYFSSSVGTHPSSHPQPVMMTEEAKSARRSAFLVVLFSIVGAAITCVFTPMQTFILATLSIALFVYAVYPVFGLCLVRFDTLAR